MTGAELIAQERTRQVRDEGWLPMHDDEHDAGQLVMAAICYATPRGRRRFVPKDLQTHASSNGRGDSIPDGWPWSPDAWKPDDRLRELVKAGALLAAEIDRLLRERQHLRNDDAAKERIQREDRISELEQCLRQVLDSGALSGKGWAPELDRVRRVLKLA